MEERSYTTVDKSEWPRGPWDSEPDKIQFMTKAGLLGLIVRGPAGALCGYVGVAEGHPYHGIDYDGCLVKCGGQRYTIECEHESPGSRLDAHGGLTFSSACREPTRDGWEKWRAYMRERLPEIKTYPRGDAARDWKKLGHLIDDYDGWAEHIRASAICHIADPGSPDHVWWFGFDCAHLYDLIPSANWRSDGIYRDLSYVREEVESLAEQLKAIA